MATGGVRGRLGVQRSKQAGAIAGAAPHPPLTPAAAPRAACSAALMPRRPASFRAPAAVCRGAGSRAREAQVEAMPRGSTGRPECWLAQAEAQYSSAEQCSPVRCPRRRRRRRQRPRRCSWPRLQRRRPRWRRCQRRRPPRRMPCRGRLRQPLHTQGSISKKNRRGAWGPCLAAQGGKNAAGAAAFQPLPCKPYPAHPPPARARVSSSRSAAALLSSRAAPCAASAPAWACMGGGGRGREQSAGVKRANGQWRCEAASGQPERGRACRLLHPEQPLLPWRTLSWPANRVRRAMSCMPATRSAAAGEGKGGGRCGAVRGRLSRRADENVAWVLSAPASVKCWCTLRAATSAVCVQNSGMGQPNPACARRTRGSAGRARHSAGRRGGGALPQHRLQHVLRHRALLGLDLRGQNGEGEWGTGAARAVGGVCSWRAEVARGSRERLRRPGAAHSGAAAARGEAADR